MVIYMAVTADDLELPVYVAGSIKELAEMTGRSYGSICTLISRPPKNGAVKKLKFYKIEVEEKEV